MSEVYSHQTEIEENAEIEQPENLFELQYRLAFTSLSPDAQEAYMMARWHPLTSDHTV